MTSWIQPLSAAAKKRSDAGRKAHRPRVDAVLHALRSRGIKVCVVGSYAKPDVYFDAQWSDIDLLIKDAAGWDVPDIWMVALESVEGLMIDIVMAEDLDPTMLAFMKVDVQELHPPGPSETGKLEE